MYSDKMVRLWVRNEEGRFEESDSSPMEGHRYGINQVEFSPNGELLASCSLDGSTILWDTRVRCSSRTVDTEYTRCVCGGGDKCFCLCFCCFVVMVVEI